MDIRSIKNALKPLIKYPIHPQWHTSNITHLKQHLSSTPSGATVLDIGCADMWPKNHIPPSCHYIGLDYYQTATEWYGTKPRVYADAQKLPISDESIDNVVCLDVIEHLESAQTTIQEISRVLKPGGRAIIKVPFIYPLHDTPRDFIRLTPFGMKELSDTSHLELTESFAQGSSLQTSALISNIAITQLFITWLKSKNPLCLLLPLLPPYILINNLMSSVLTLMGNTEQIMPFSYTFILHKPQSST